MLVDLLLALVNLGCSDPLSGSDNLRLSVFDRIVKPYRESITLELEFGLPFSLLLLLTRGFRIQDRRALVLKMGPSKPVGHRFVLYEQVDTLIYSQLIQLLRWSIRHHLQLSHIVEHRVLFEHHNVGMILDCMEFSDLSLEIFHRERFLHLQIARLQSLLVERAQSRPPHVNFHGHTVCIVLLKCLFVCLLFKGKSFHRVNFEYLQSLILAARVSIQHDAVLHVVCSQPEIFPLLLCIFAHELLVDHVEECRVCVLSPIDIEYFLGLLLVIIAHKLLAGLVDNFELHLLRFLFMLNPDLEFFGFTLFDIFLHLCWDLVIVDGEFTPVLFSVNKSIHKHVGIG